MEKVYRFTGLRVKNKPDMKDSKYVEVQSTKKTTVSNIDAGEFQLMIAQSKKFYQGDNKSSAYNPKPQQQ
jgi:hypothetical protein